MTVDDIVRGVKSRDCWSHPTMPFDFSKGCAKHHDFGGECGATVGMRPYFIHTFRRTSRNRTHLFFFSRPLGIGSGAKRRKFKSGNRCGHLCWMPPNQKNLVEPCWTSRLRLRGGGCWMKERSRRWWTWSRHWDDQLILLRRCPMQIVVDVLGTRQESSARTLLRINGALMAWT